MKITYENGKEFLESFERNKWFTFEAQDRLILQMAFEMWLEEEKRDGKTFWNCLETSKELLRVYYNHRYNPETRTGR